MLALELPSKKSHDWESGDENPAAQAVHVEHTLMLKCLV